MFLISVKFIMSVIGPVVFNKTIKQQKVPIFLEGTVMMHMPHISWYNNCNLRKLEIVLAAEPKVQ